MALKLKQGLSLFFTLILVLTMLPTPALASASEEGSENQDTQTAIDAIRDTEETPESPPSTDADLAEDTKADEQDSVPPNGDESQDKDVSSDVGGSDVSDDIDQNNSSDNKENGNCETNDSNVIQESSDDPDDLLMDAQQPYENETFEAEDADCYTDRLNLYRGADLESGSFLAYADGGSDTLVIDGALTDSDPNCEFTITGVGGGRNRVEINTDCTVYLRDVTVQDVEAGQSAVTIAPGADVIIVVAGACTLTGGEGGCGIAVPTGSSLTIQGETGSDSLTATGTGQWAAGIGYFVKDGIGCGEIAIQNMGSVIAYGGYYNEGTQKDNGPEGGPAIGGGTSYQEYSSNTPISTITLQDCDSIEAYGGSKAAGIGSGFWNTVNVTIDGCKVHAEGGATAPAIGTARNTYARESLTTTVLSNVRITDSTIEAQGGYYGAGIGSGYSDQSLGDYSRPAEKKMTFVAVTLGGDSKVTAKGGKLAAGIGGGYKNYGDSVTIGDGCIVYAYGGEHDKGGKKIPCGIGSGADGSGLFSDMGGEIAIADGAEVYAFSYGFEAMEPLASKWAVSRELDDQETSATILQCRFLVDDTLRENEKGLYSEDIGVLAYDHDYTVTIARGATSVGVPVPAGYTCVAATVEPGTYQVTVNGKTQSSLASVAYAAKTDGAVTANPSVAYEAGTHREDAYARYAYLYQPYGNNSDTVTIQYTFGDPSASFPVTPGVNSFDAVAYRPSVVPIQHEVSYQWDGAIPPSGVTLPASAVIAAGDTYTPDAVYRKHFTLAGAYNGVEGVFSFSGWDQTAAFVVETDSILHGTWIFTPHTVVPATGTVTGLVFHDRDRNSIYSAADDAVLSGVTVSLWKQIADSNKRTWIDTGNTATTGADGKYLFPALEPGVYQVRLRNRPSGMNRDCSVIENDIQGNKFASSAQGYETGELLVATKEETIANAGFYYRSSNSGSNGNSGGSSGGKTPTTITDPETPLAPALNTSDHYGYVIGYPVDYETGEPATDMSRWPVKPQGSITRAEAATIFFRMLTDESRASFWKQENSYSDVEAGQWFNNAISTLSHAGVIDGYPDGTFRPNSSISRAEFAALAVRFFEVSYDGEDLFSDISGHWAQTYINQAGHAGLVSGYPDGTFQPQQSITRAEAVTLVNRTLGRSPHKDHFLDDMIRWPDNGDTSAWYYADIQEATNSHECDQATPANVAESYESWTKLLETRDWAALEQAWADANASPSPGEVIS